MRHSRHNNKTTYIGSPVWFNRPSHQTYPAASRTLTEPSQVSVSTLEVDVLGKEKRRYGRSHPSRCFCSDERPANTSE